MSCDKNAHYIFTRARENIVYLRESRGLTVNGAFWLFLQASESDAVAYATLEVSVDTEISILSMDC